MTQRETLELHESAAQRHEALEKVLAELLNNALQEGEKQGKNGNRTVGIPNGATSVATF